MSSPAIPRVETSTEARTGLSGHLREFRALGAAAAPVIIGDRRKPEAALIPIEMYERLLDTIEEISLEAVVRERVAAGGERPLDDLISDLGLEGQVG